ncbi:uncharacterized protein LOC143448296 [Clavelina lepadiformis]|uniref:uncharacterized protein LOC143448296 n=1 Tax=Clavelina lepadiformis TaxID=159417 RepID=UPI004041527C
METASPSTPRIANMYEPIKCLPSKHPKTHYSTGKFTDWGTKLYQLELELSYKNNEIAILKKKLKTFAEELYPEGNMAKTSRVSILRKKYQASEAEVLRKNRLLESEKKRTRKVERELSSVKQLYSELRHQKTNNDKGVQTAPENNKSVQVKPRSPTTTRSIMTQCTPVYIKSPRVTVESSTQVKITKQIQNKETQQNNIAMQQYENQPFGKLQNNKQITGKSIATITSSPTHDFDVFGDALTSDSGISSGYTLDESNEVRIKPSYTEILNRSFPIYDDQHIAYEQSLHHYVNNTQPPQTQRLRPTTPLMTSSLRIYSRSGSSLGQPNYTAKKVMGGNKSCTTTPCYLFRRSSSRENPTGSENPVFVYKTQINVG